MTKLTSALGQIPKLTAAFLAMGMGSAMVQASEVELPPTVIWSAYPTGTTGYSQAVGLGKVLQSEYGTNLRVIPGRNDVARFEPLRRKRAEFVAGGSEAMSAQEGIRDFGKESWGPQPVRSGLWNLADGCSFSLQVHGDSDMHTIEDIKGKRVPFIKGAPAPNAGFEYLMSYAGLTWDDVEVVELGGYMNMIEAFLDNQLDVKWNACNSAALHRVANAPRGMRFIEFPHDNAEAVARVSAKAPWFVPHVTTDAVGVDASEGLEVFTSPYPLLSVYADTDTDLVYNLTKAMHIHFDDYQGSAPGMEGWAMDRQPFETNFLPFHDGVVRYFKEIGVWTDEAEANQQQQLRRQQVLQDAWKAYTADAPSDEESFAKGWMQTRYDALVGAELIPLMERW